MKKEGKVMIIVIILLIFAILFLFNQKPKYNLYHNDIRFKNVKDSYRVGQKVKLYYDLIATDTDYHFSVEGVEYDLSYSDTKGYIIEFIMPNNDVTIHLEIRNSMEVVNYINEELFFYRHEMVGVEDPEYYEITIKNENGTFVAYEYTHKSAYIFYVDDQLYKTLNDYTQQKNHFEDWQKADEALEGMQYHFKYYIDEEEFSIHSDQMISEGEKVFNEIYQIIQDHLIK